MVLDFWFRETDIFLADQQFAAPINDASGGNETAKKDEEEAEAEVRVTDTASRIIAIKKQGFGS